MEVNLLLYLLHAVHFLVFHLVKLANTFLPSIGKENNFTDSSYFP